MRGSSTLTSPPPSPSGTSLLPAPSRKKRSSPFTGLFVKEPTQVALNQVAVQLKAQHGALDARSVPRVSAARMPGFVPKVNSKWDGIPEAVRIRDREEKERQRAARGHPFLPSSMSSLSNDSQERDFFEGKSVRRTSSTDLSLDFSAGDRGSNMSRRPAATSSNSYSTYSSDGFGPLGSDRPCSTWSQSLRSPSGTSLPHITSYFPNDDPAPVEIPSRTRGIDYAHTQSSNSSDCTRVELPHLLSIGVQAPTVDALPDHSSSPFMTPQERSPITPSPAHMGRTTAIRPVPDPDAIRLGSSGIDVLGFPSASIYGGATAAAPFPIGKARSLNRVQDTKNEDSPVQQVDTASAPTLQTSSITTPRQDRQERPTTSGERLGLRASKVSRSDVAPWEE